MKSTDWNRLRRGDPVFVHTAGAATQATEPGVVRFVETGIDLAANSVGIRLGRPEYFVVWPRAEAVHDGPSAPPGTCWRCDGVAPVMRPTPRLDSRTREQTAMPDKSPQKPAGKQPGMSLERS